MPDPRPDTRPDTASENETAVAERHTAGAFDIRNVIGGLLAAYGVVLVLMGLLGSTAETKTGGINANLWAGVVLLVVGGAFILWATTRPIVVPDDVPEVVDDPTRPAPRKRRRSAR